MKLTEHFATFLTEEVNLNDTRFRLLQDSTEALKAVIHSSGWQPNVQGFSAHGSWAHKTIIKPVDAGEFDADLLVKVAPVSGWTAKEYLSTLRSIFVGNETYAGKVVRSSHCITIEYAGERKVDIAPCVCNRSGYGEQEVCNFNTDEFEPTAPEKYTEWLLERNAWAANNSLRKVTRLLKYLRDIKETFTCPSVLFTTLLGLQINQLDTINNQPFADLPSALKTVVGRLDDWLQARPNRPSVPNPALVSEDLGLLWDEDKYVNFREKIHAYREWIDDAYNEPDRDESIGKWRRVFGDAFAGSVAIDKATRISEAARQLAASTALSTQGFLGDLVSIFVRFGKAALPAGFDRLPHKQRPRWKASVNPLFTLQVTARYHSARSGGTWLKTICSGEGPLVKGRWLQFFVQTSSGTPIGTDFTTHWRVTNTDQEARNASALRGGFEPSNDGNTRWEHLEYRGVHQVEAFVVRNRDKMLVAQSDPYYVVIE